MSVQVGTVTALTIISGVAILTVYIFLLKMNGWIGKSSDESKKISEYEKPSQKDNKKMNPTVKNPEIVKSRPNFAASSNVDKRPRTTMIASSLIKLEAPSSTPKIIEKQSYRISNSNKDHIIEKTFISTPESKENGGSQSSDNEMILKQENTNATIDRPKACKNYFGYLSIHPKDKLLPDECLICHKLIECPKIAITKTKEKDNSQTTNKDEIVIKQEVINAKKEKPERCKNYVGYIGVLPKSTPLPDECFACRRLIECAKNTKA